MHSLSRMNTITRCKNLWYASKLEGTGIGAGDRLYLLYVCHHPRVSQDTLSAALYVNKSSVTRRLAHLEREGFVTRTPSADDRRVMLVAPTEKALALLPRLAELREEWNAIITEGFTEAELEAFSHLIDRALQNAKQKAKEIVE